MQRFKNILFVNEPGTSKTGTPRAVVELARQNGARITLCDVAYELARSFTQLKQSLESLRRQRLKALLELSQMTEAPLQSITDFALEEAVRLTNSKIG